MDPFYAADPGANEPIPPPYEASEYDRKLSDAVQRSLYISNPPTAPSPPWQQRDTSQSRPVEAARASVRSSLPPPPSPSFRQLDPNRPSSSAGSHHRQNSTSSHGTSASGGSRVSAASRSSKERPSWYNEAGLGGSSDAAPSRYLGTPSRQPAYNSSSSSQAPSPTDDAPPRLSYENSFTNNALDEEAGIDNPPPPFAVSNQSATATPYRPRADDRQSTVTNTSYAQSSTSYQSPRSSYESAAPSQPPQDYSRNHTAQPRQRPTRRRSGSMSFAGHPLVVQQQQQPGGGSPHLAFDKNVAYAGFNSGGNNNNGGLPPGAANPLNAASLYSSAVSSILTAKSTSSSSNYTNNASHPAPQRQSTYGSVQSPGSSLSPSSSESSGYFSGQRPASAQGPSAYQQQQNWNTPQRQQSSSQDGGSVRSASRNSLTPMPTRPPSAPAHHPQQHSSYAPTHHQTSSYATNQQQSQPYANNNSAYHPSAYFTTAAPAPNPMAAPKRQSVQANMYYPGAVPSGPAPAERWVPPGAAAPTNLYARRFA